MSEYLPHSEQHSLQEVRVAIHFQRAFSSHEVERALTMAEANLKQALPKAAEVRGGEITVDATNPDSPISTPIVPAGLIGFERSRITGNGQPARVLRLAGNLLSVSILDYESWKITRRDSVKYMLTVLAQLPLDANPIMAANLQFINRYAFNGDIRDAKAGFLLRAGNKYITERCFIAGPLWHCHTGWFDGDHSNGRILNHLNVSSAVVDQCATVTIDHNATFQLNIPRQSTQALLEPPDENAGFNAILDQLHDRSKAILGDMLTPEMSERIGL